MSELLPYPLIAFNQAPVFANPETRDQTWPGEIGVKPSSGAGVTWANPETRAQAWPGEIGVKPPLLRPVMQWRKEGTAMPPLNNIAATMGIIRGQTTLQGVGQRGKRVICFNESMLPLAECWTSGEGGFLFELLPNNQIYTVMAFDSGDFKYAPVAADRRIPEAYQ